MGYRPAKVLTVFSLAMITIAGIVNLRSLPITASVGLSSIFFYLLATLVFLIPSALICSELASSWPLAGGLYQWVRKAFGDKTGFFAIWSEWFNNVISFPAGLSFIAATIAFIFFHHLNLHKGIVFLLMMVIIWSCTLFNFLGIKASSRLNILGAIFGTFIPATIIVALGITWLVLGKPSQIHFTIHNLFPPMHFGNLAFFIGILSSYAGMQITAFHAHNVKHPKHAFPRAITIAVILILFMTILPTLAIAIVVPKAHLSLVAGVMEGFLDFFSAFHLGWALPVLAVLIALSGISTLAAWLLAPARGLVVAAQQGFFPKWCAHENSRGIPTNILLLQAVIASLLALLFLVMPNLSSAFWVLIVLTSQFTLVLYILMFSSAIKLRYSHSFTPRPFKVPGGWTGIWLIAGISMIACLAGIVLGFFPPAQLVIGSVPRYELIIIAGDLLYIVLPLIIFRSSYKKSHHEQFSSH